MNAQGTVHVRPARSTDAAPTHFSAQFWNQLTVRFGWTRCESSVVEQLLAERTDKEIADHLHCSIDNVKKHLSSAARKMSVRGRLRILGRVHTLYRETWQPLPTGEQPE